MHNKEMKNIEEKQITYNVTLMIKVQQDVKLKYVYLHKHILSN